MRASWLMLAGALVSTACGASPHGSSSQARNDGSVVIDRFSEAAGHLQVRTADNGLPAAGAPIDFDQPPFITQSRGPSGEIIRYYNFDIQPPTPGRVFELVKPDGTPATGAVPIVTAIPGEPGYSDFLQRVQVTVPAYADASTFHDEASLAGLATKPLSAIVNRPIVPAGSVARERLNGASPALEQVYYRGQLINWLRFDEVALSIEPAGSTTPTSPIYVTFKINPDKPGGGPPSGFVTEPDGVQTHNVASSLPGDLDYSPLWLVSVYDNASFPTVSNLRSVLGAPFIARGVSLVNCPVVFVASPPTF